MDIDKDHTITEVTDNDYNWIISYLRKLRKYLEYKSGQNLQEVPEPKFLDEYFQVALDDLKRGKINGDDLVNMFGAGFGQYFEEKTDFKWVIYSDKYGTDLAIRNTITGVIGFPLSSTSKRLFDEYAGTFEGIFVALTTWKNK
jgi:hypothetical protein